MKTELEDYDLWWDGFIEIDPNGVEDALVNGVPPEKIAVTEMSTDINNFNRLSMTKILADHELQVDEFDYTWRIPPEYQELDLNQYVSDKMLDIPNDEWLEIRTIRVRLELSHFIDRGYSDLLRTLIYMVDTFREKNIVWGVGRGSSCASYLLYLIGIHSVDPIKYDIPLDEFFRSS